MQDKLASGMVQMAEPKPNILEENTPGLAEGSLFFAGGFPDPWPVAEPSILCEISLKGGKLVFGWIPSGQIEVSLLEGELEHFTLVHSIRSPKIRKLDKLPVGFTVLWKDRAFSDLRMNGESVLTTVREIVLDREARVPDCTDYAEKNEAARLFRVQRLAQIAPKPNRIEGGEDYMIQALRDEIDQLHDLIETVESGREAHVPGLAARVRVLTIGRPFGLLQHCAACRGLPLIVFSDPKPEMEPPIIKPSGRMWFSPGISPEPDTIYINPIDIDVLMALPALGIGDTVSSYDKVIRAIGDTIGAHRDPGIDPLVAALASRRTKANVRYHDVQQFVLSVSKATLSLSKFVSANW